MANRSSASRRHSHVPVEGSSVLRLGFIFVVLRFTANAAVEVRWPIGKTIDVLLAGTIGLLSIIVEYAHHRDEGAVRPLECSVRFRTTGGRARGHRRLPGC